MDLIDQIDHLLARLLVPRIELAIDRLVVLQAGQPLLLQAAQPPVALGDLVEGLEHAVPDRGLHGRERQRALVEIVLVLGLGLGFGLAPGRLTAVLGSAVRPRLGWLGVLALGLGAAVGRLEIDHVAQQDLALADLVAPADDRAHGQRALAQGLEHGVAPGLDALGDLDLALAREQLDRAHLAQIHPHRVVGPAEVLLVDRGRALLLLALALEISLRPAGAVAALVIAADAHAHLLEHRDQLVEQVGRDLLLGQRGVDLVERDEAALARLGDQALERRHVADQLLGWAVRHALARRRLERRSRSRDRVFAIRPFLSAP